jgi:hypothetical protein
MTALSLTLQFSLLRKAVPSALSASVNITPKKFSELNGRNGAPPTSVQPALAVIQGLSENLDDFSKPVTHCSGPI